MLSSGLPELVGDDEDLARFLTQRSHFTAAFVRPSVFLPRPHENETSVSRHGSEPRDDLWKIGLGAAGDRHLYGAAIVDVATIRSLALDVLEDEPPDRHAVIKAWPAEIDAESQKARRKELASVIASAAGPPVLR